MTAGAGFVPASRVVDGNVGLSIGDRRIVPGGEGSEWSASMGKPKGVKKRRALSAQEFSTMFRRDPENERLYRESQARLDLAERVAEMERAARLLKRPPLED